MEQWRIKNRPLRIVESSVLPNRLITLEAGDPCTIRFAATIDDPDLAAGVTGPQGTGAQERITSRWFVTGGDRPSLIEIRILAPIENTASYELKLNQAGSPITTPGIYLVDLRVSDGAFKDATLNSESEPEHVDNGLVDMTYVDGVSWTVNLTTDVANCVDSPADSPGGANP